MITARPGWRRVRHLLARSGPDAPLATLLLGNFGSGNVGNEASLATVIAGLRRGVNGAEITCVCSDPLVVTTRHGVPAVPLRRSRPEAESGLVHLVLRLPRMLVDLVSAARIVRRHEVVIVPGTSILDDFGDGPTGMPYDLLVWALASRLARRPMVLLAVGAGPIRHPLSRRMLVLAARLTTGRSFRDEGSRAYMSSVGLDVTGDRIVPDVVFAAEPPARPSTTGTVHRIGVGVMDYRGWSPDHPHRDWLYSDQLARTAELVERLVSDGAEVVLLPAEPADHRAGERCLARIDGRPRDRVTLADVPASVDDLMAVLVGLDALVAPRFHMVLSALIAGVPTVALGYAPRSAELLAAAGLERVAHGIETFDPEAVADDVRALVAERDRIGADLREWVRHERSQVLEQFHRMEEDLV